MSLRIKLFLVITSVLVFIGLITGFIINWQNNKKIKEHTNTDIKNTINYTFQLVNFYFNRAEDGLIDLASDPVIINALEIKKPEKLAQASEKMTVINEIMGAIENIVLYEVKDSNCIARTSNKEILLSVVDKDFSERDYCKGIIKNKASYFSSVYIGSVTKSPVISLAIPVKNTKGEMLGFIMGTINPSELRGYLWDLQEDSSVVLLDRYGMLFLDTTRDIKKIDTTITTTSEVKKRLANNENEGYFRDQNNFIGYRFNNYITVIYKKTTESSLAFFNELFFIIIFAPILVIILVAFFIYFFVGLVTKRILRLSKISEAIASGQFSTEINEKDLKVKDETGVLGRSLNEMAKKLSDLYKNLDKKVQDKTKDLNSKVDELEKMNKFMVDRELKMIELKKEISKLKMDNENIK